MPENKTTHWIKDTRWGGGGCVRLTVSYAQGRLVLLRLSLTELYSLIHWIHRVKHSGKKSCMPRVYHAGCCTLCSIPAISRARIPVNANFGLWLSFSLSLHTSACDSRGAPDFPSLASVRGCELMNMSRTARPVMVSVSCSLVWRSSPGLWIPLSAPISPPNTDPSPGADVFQTLKLPLWALWFPATCATYSSTALA